MVCSQPMDPGAVNLIKATLDIDIQTNSNQEEINMCQAVEEWKQELLDEGEKLGIEKGENAILKALIQNSGLSLNEIANMTCKPLSILESLAAQT